MRRPVIATLLAAALASGCTVQQKARTADAQGITGCDNTSPVTLDELWTRYLGAAPTSSHGGCALSGCHLDGAGGLTFSSPAELAAATIGVAATTASGERVVPDDAAASVLYQRLSDSAGTSQMPPGGPYLTSAELHDVAGWICAGAPAASSIDGGSGGDGGTGGDTTPPTFAGAASATPSPNAVTLSWKAASDAVTPAAQIVYLVYQASSAGGERFATPSYTTPPGATSFTVGKLAINTKYYFVVRARDAAGNVDGNQVEVSATTPAIADTQAPSFTGASSATVSGQSITIAWTAASDDVTPPGQIVYLVYQATSAGGESFATPTYTTAPGAASYTVSGLMPSTTYYFVVRAQDQAGNVAVNTTEVSGKTTIVSFSAQVEPIFLASCANAGCHTGARPAEGLDLGSAAKAYTNLVGVLSTECTATKRVAPGAASASYLVWKLQGSGSCFFGSQMPKTGSLSTADLDAVIGWVAEGAPNN